VTVNAEDCPDLLAWYGIQSIPTLLLFVDGAPRIRIVGTANRQAILGQLHAASPAEHTESFASSASQQDTNAPEGLPSCAVTLEAPAARLQASTNLPVGRDAPICRGGIPRNGKLCQCANCGIVERCTPSRDFYTTTRQDGPLMCATCIRQYTGGILQSLRPGINRKSHPRIQQPAREVLDTV